MSQIQTIAAILATAGWEQYTHGLPAVHHPASGVRIFFKKGGGVVRGVAESHTQDGLVVNMGKRDTSLTRHLLVGTPAEAAQFAADVEEGNVPLDFSTTRGGAVKGLSTAEVMAAALKIAASK